MHIEGQRTTRLQRGACFQFGWGLELQAVAETSSYLFEGLAQGEGVQTVHVTHIICIKVLNFDVLDDLRGLRAWR